MSEVLIPYVVLVTFMLVGAVEEGSTQYLFLIVYIAFVWLDVSWFHSQGIWKWQGNLVGPGQLSLYFWRILFGTCY
jgi:hypothetical protein